MINTVPSVLSEENESGHSVVQEFYEQYKYQNMLEDLDQLVDLQVTVEINTIRAFDIIDKHSEPDFYVKVFINDNEFKSPVWKNQKYVENPSWSATCDVPDDQENVTIKIQLWDWNLGFNRLCDIASDNQDRRAKDIELIYNLKIGHWYGDDFTNSESTFADPSGYGRANGCDDNSIYREDRDCELFFDFHHHFLLTIAIKFLFSI